jgi:hypothetical protein
VSSCGWCAPMASLRAPHAVARLTGSLAGSGHGEPHARLHSTVSKAHKLCGMGCSCLCWVTLMVGRGLVLQKFKLDMRVPRARILAHLHSTQALQAHQQQHHERHPNLNTRY